jgi:dienelactone hydrolase
MKKALKIVGGVLAGLFVLLLIAKVSADKTYFNDYDPKLPFDAKVSETAVVEDTGDFFGITRNRRYEKVVFSMQTRKNERMPVILTLPKTRTGKIPAIVFLHGIGQSKGFIEEICTPFNEGGFAMACFDQSMQGERKIKGGALQQAIAFRQRPWKTINDGRRLIDYLQTHPDIDPERIYLVGASYGAITGTSLTAFDKRIKAADLVVGGANIRVLLDAPLITGAVKQPILHWLGKQLVATIMKPADPMNWAPGTKGTPVLMQNGSLDTLVSPDAGKELYKYLGEPKEIRWYPCDHPGLDKTQAKIILQILDEGLVWLQEKDKLYQEKGSTLASLK